MSQSKSWCTPVDWKSAINKSRFGLTSVLKIKASFSLLHVQGAALGLGFMGEYYSIYHFYGCPRNLDVCPQPLGLICLARMGAGAEKEDIVPCKLEQ